MRRWAAMTKTLVILGMIIIITTGLSGCIGTPDSKEEFVLLPMEAPGDVPKDDSKPAVTKPADDKKTMTIQGKIIEYDKKNKTVKILLGSSSGLKKGMNGKIFNDAAKTQENGSISLTTVFSNYCEGQIRAVAYEINKKEAIAVFEIDD
jgi:hypothetical protein